MTDQQGRTLPPFPVDDFTLTQLEHALDTSWAYDHQDESEKVGPAHNGGGVVSIVRYSTDPDHYQPMCKCCHRKFDADERKSNRAELAQPELESGDQQ